MRQEMNNPQKSITTYTAQELATILCMARNTVYQQRRTGRLPKGQKHGSRRLWTRQELIRHSPELQSIFGFEK